MYYQVKHIHQDDEDLAEHDLEECCTICCIEFEELEFIKVLKCQDNAHHMFHYECILQWLNKKLQCPNCNHNYEQKFKEMRKKT